MRFLESVAEEMREIQLAANREAARGNRRVTPAQAVRAANIATGFSWLNPGTVAALAEVGADDATVERVARVAAKVRSDRGWRKPGQKVKARALGPAPGEWQADRLAGMRALPPGLLDKGDVAPVLEATARDAAGVSRGAAQAAIQEDRRPQFFNVPRIRGEDEDVYRERSIDEFFARPDTTVDVNELEGGFGGGTVKPVVRGLGMGLNAGYQELQGQFRNLVNNFADFDDPRQFLETQSDLGIVLEQAVAGEEVDTGSGFFVDPKSAVAQERQRRELERGNIGGHAITVGRWAADSVGFEPDTFWFDAFSGLGDLGVAWHLDPAARAGNKVGVYRSLTKIVRPDRVEGWLASDGAKVIQRLAETDSAVEIWRASGKKMPATAARDLAAARTVEEVREVLRPALGTTLREFPTMPGAVRTAPRRVIGRTVGGKKGYLRLGQAMPSSRVDLDDPDDVLEQVDRYLRNAKVPKEKVDEMVNRASRAFGSHNELFGVFEDVMGTVADEIATEWVALGRKAKPEDARRVVRIYVDSHKKSRAYFVDAVGDEVDHPLSVLNGRGQPIPSKHLWAEMVGRHMPLPDAREIRRMTSPLRNILDVAPVQVLETVGMWATMRWKEGALLRAAYPLRVITEEQARMAAAGHASMFSHPLSYIAWAVGRNSDVFDNAFQDVERFRQAMTRGDAGWRRNPNVVRTRHYTTYARDEEEFLGSWADEIGELHADPIAKALVEGRAVDEIKDAFFGGDLTWVRKELIAASSKGVRLRRRRLADDYVDSVLDRINIKTGNDPRLLEAVRSGKLNGARISDDNATLNKAFMDELQKVMDEGVGPDEVKGVITAHSKARSGVGRTAAKAAQKYDDAVEWGFVHLMSKPTNFLSRSPVFRQQYWHEMERLMPFLDEGSRVKALAQAENAGVATQKMRKARPSGRDLDLKDADTIAKAHALNETKALLYDLSERNQFFDIARMVIPFGDAWKEVFGRWAKLTVERPLVPARRVQQIVEGARDTGVFYEDPISQEWMFRFPLLGRVNQAFLDGAPIPMMGRVQGLSMVGEVTPGLGPVGQIAAGWLIPDTPDWDWLRNELLPFGEFENPTEFRSWMPPWMQKLITAKIPTTDQVRLLGNATKDLMAWGASTGEYDFSTDAGIRAAAEDAKHKAKAMFLVRGVEQFFAPTAPSPQMVVKDKNGTIQVIGQLRKEYFEKAQELDDWDAAFEWFLEKYGMDLYPVIQAKSFTVVFGAPTTKQGLNWVKEHKSVERDYPNVYGYFAPKGDPDDFSFEAYDRQFSQGEREDITPEQYGQLANHRIASFLYRKEREAFPVSLSREQSQYLNRYQRALMGDYPGYLRTGGLPQRATQDQVIEELKQAAKDETILATDAGQALAEYMEARAFAEEASIARGYSDVDAFRRTKNMADVRDWLRSLGEALARDHPEFTELWDGVLAAEMLDEEEG